MSIEIVGQQLRIRVKSPRKFSEFKTDDVGQAGKLQRIAGRKSNGKWETQAWRLNLSNYENFNDIEIELDNLEDKGEISLLQRNIALTKASKWWKNQ